MKKLCKVMAVLFTLVMVLNVNAIAFASEKNDVYQIPIVEVATMSNVVSVFDYTNSNFYIESNQGQFKPSFSSNNARIVVAAKRADNVHDGTITVTVYKKNLLGKDKVGSFTCQADGKSHTSSSFSIKKGATYLVDITTSTAHKSIVAVNIAAEN